MQKSACVNVTRYVKFLELRKIVIPGTVTQQIPTKKLVSVKKKLFTLADCAVDRP